MLSCSKVTFYFDNKNKEACVGEKMLSDNGEIKLRIIPNGANIITNH